MAKRGAALHPFPKATKDIIKGVARVQQRILIWTAVQEAMLHDNRQHDDTEEIPKVDRPHRQQQQAQRIHRGDPGPVPAMDTPAYHQALLSSKGLSKATSCSSGI